MTIHRRKALQAGLGLAASAALPGLALAQSAGAFPNGVIKFSIPTQAGGGHDIMMRLVGQKLTEAWGQPTIVESKPGANGGIAAAAVARAAPDGLNLLMAFSGFLSNTLLLSSPGYKIGDFAPVSMLVLTPIALAVRTDLKIDTLKDYVAYCKANPGKVSYGSYGQGSGGHFVGELLSASAGISPVHVPYKGETPALQDLLAGQIHSAVVSLGGAERFPGKIKALAISSPTRFPVYPNVPTFADGGFPEVNMPGFAAIMAPAGTPKPVVDKLSAELNRVIKLPDVAARMLEIGFDPAGWGPDRLSAFLKDQLVLTQKLVGEGRVKA